MANLAEIRAECDQLQSRLARKSGRSELHAVYLALATVVSQIQGAVADASSERPERGSSAHASLEELKASMRQVGLDIRLASEQSLLIGLQLSIQHAFATLDTLRSVS